MSNQFSTHEQDWNYSHAGPHYSLEQYLKRMEKLHRGGMRRGQHAWLLLQRVRPNLAQVVLKDANLDPFYRDELLPDFLAYIQAHWDDFDRSPGLPRA